MGPNGFKLLYDQNGVTENTDLKITSIILDFAVLKTAARLTSQNHGYLAVFANTSL